MLHSYELFARYVAPYFQGQTQTMQANREWVVATGGGPGRTYVPAVGSGDAVTSNR
jgi:hypothetical protein